MISTADAPSVICEELPAVTLPSALNAGFKLASVSTVVPSRMPSSLFHDLVELHDLVLLAVPELALQRDDLVVEAAFHRGPPRHAAATGTERVEVFARQAPLVGDELSGDALGDEPALGSYRPNTDGPNGTEPGVIDAPIGVVDITSTPAAMTMSYAPAITPCAAKWTDCCDEPHCRSIVVPGTVSGQPAPSTALRPMFTLAAHLHDAAHDHVVDERRIEAVALLERLQHLGGEVGGMPAGELSVALAAGGADGVDDDGGGGHGTGSLMDSGLDRAVKSWPRLASPVKRW